MRFQKKTVAWIISTAVAFSCLAVPAWAAEETNCLLEISRKPKVTVSSNILGMADTGNKTSLKKTLQKTSSPGDINIYYYNEEGKRVTYDPGTVVELDPVQYTGSAWISLGDDVDDSKIDSSQAVVRLVDGNTYHANEFVLSESAGKLHGEWKNGTLEYTLQAGDLEWNTWGYTWPDYNSDREWSIMGGDGAGDYFFTFEVSGIRYDGKELDPVTFPVTVYCYGRTVTDLALSTEYIPNVFDESYTTGKKQGLFPQWTWYTEGEESAMDKPYLNDTYTDYFSVTWPIYLSGANVKEDDVTITLKSEYGDCYVLQPVNEYGEREYAVRSTKEETEIFVTYQQWALNPVYSTMEIAVNCNGKTYTKEYEVASVAAYMVQTGGGGITVDGTVTCYNYYGIADLNENAVKQATYTLSASIDGEEQFYCETSEGVPFLSQNKESAKAFDASGEDDCNVQIIHNVVFVQTRVGQTEEKVVNDQKIVFTKNYSSRISKDAAQVVRDQGATLEKGYDLVGSYANWAWTMRYQAGWTVETEQPDGLPFVRYPYGYAPGSVDPVYARYQK